MTPGGRPGGRPGGGSGSLRCHKMFLNWRIEQSFRAYSTFSKTSGLLQPPTYARSVVTIKTARAVGPNSLFEHRRRRNSSIDKFGASSSMLDGQNHQNRLGCLLKPPLRPCCGSAWTQKLPLCASHSLCTDSIFFLDRRSSNISKSWLCTPWETPRDPHK